MEMFCTNNPCRPIPGQYKEGAICGVRKADALKEILIILIILQPYDFA